MPSQTGKQIEMKKQLQQQLLDEEEKMSLSKKNVTRMPLRDPLEEAKLRAKNVNIELEFSDSLKANHISFAFIDFSTPAFDITGAAVPNSFYFSFKFYTSKETNTQKVLLVSKEDLNKGKFKHCEQPKASTDYYLVMEQ